MLNKKEFDVMVREMQDADKLREFVIMNSRDVLKLSKQAIYSVHRKNLSDAEALLKKASMIINRMRKQTEGPSNEGIFSAAVQEYAEAACYLSFVKKSNVLTRKELNVSTEDYLGGLSDLTGELGRKAVLFATSGDIKKVTKIRDVIDAIHGQFLRFDFRNSELRKKSDAIKWNLKKVEELLYDLRKK